MPLPEMILTRKDFDNCNWQEIVFEVKERSCNAYATAFFRQAGNASKLGDRTREAAFALLGVIAALKLQLDSKTPFDHNQLSVLREDHWAVLKDLLPAIEDAELRSRISDVLWVAASDYKIAQLAAVSYLQSADCLKQTGSWVPFADRITRAMQLATQINDRKLQSKTVNQIASFLNEFDSHSALYLTMALMELLQDYGRGYPTKYAALAGKAANQAEKKQKWDLARRLWKIRAKWYSMRHKEIEQENALKRAAQTYVKEGEGLIASTNKYLPATIAFQRAITSFCKIRGTEKEVKKIRKRLRQCQIKAQAEKQSLSFKVDIADLVREARKMVAGKPLDEALFNLAFIATPPQVNELKKQAEATIQQSLSTLFPQVRIDDKGRVTARGPGGISQNEEDIVLAVKNEMLGQALFHRELIAQAYIETARQTVISEHIIPIRRLLQVVSDNPFVPGGHELIYAQGLHAGLMGDLVVAAHLLIPQLENSLRYVLEQYGVSTSGLNDQGIQDVYPLTKILYPPFSSTLEDVLGKDIVFDLKGLLVERFGLNLRNLMAHGRMNEQGFASFQVLYLWWIAFRLCFVPLFNYGTTSDHIVSAKE